MSKKEACHHLAGFLLILIEEIHRPKSEKHLLVPQKIGTDPNLHKQATAKQHHQTVIQKEPFSQHRRHAPPEPFLYQLFLRGSTIFLLFPRM